MKYTVKFFVLLGIFIASIYFFGSNMDEAMFGTVKTEEMAEAELPMLELYSDGVTVNRLYGYTSAIDVFSVREHLAVVESDQTIELFINENATDVRRLQYEVLEVETGEEIAKGTINAFDKAGGKKKARIKIEDEMESGKDYAVEVMLVDSESRRIYYYFRLKRYDNSYFAEKVEFMLNFSEWAREKDEDSAKPYLESTYKGEGSTYSYVDIKDSSYMVCWGNLEPVLLTEPKVTISELYSNIAVGTLDYMVELQTDSGVEQYYVEEKFRVTVTSSSKHLLNYERTMEAVFDESLASLSQNQFKIGVTNETDMELYTNSDASMLSFVRNKELWHYNMAENTLSKIFSGRSDNEAEKGISNDQYDVKVLKLYENGDVSFMVYGHIGRGEYEGRTGILLYRYYRGEKRVEEHMYIPVSESYQKLKEELGEFCYMNEYDVFFFMAYHTMYSYNLITKELSVLAENTGDESVVFFKESKYVAWQEADYSSVQLIHLESGERKEQRAPEGEFIRILGRINDNIICGYGFREDCIVLGDGSTLYPAYQVKILDSQLQERKSYRKEEIYIAEATVVDNAIRLDRVVKTSKGYEETEDDYILNSADSKKSAVNLEYRITALMFREYYIDLPSAYKMKEIPVPQSIPYTLLSEDRTVRISELETRQEQYMVYSFGSIAGISTECGEAVHLANQLRIVGTVINEDGKIIWERGVKRTSSALKEISDDAIPQNGLTSRQAAASMMAAYLDLKIDASGFTKEQNVKEFLEKATGVRMLSLTGATLDEVLYFVYRGAPVFAMKNAEDAVVITGYSASQITVYEPASGRYKNYAIKDAEKMFEEAGNIFLSYLK